jgi:uncharacterized protein (TIGR03435 family)
MDDLAKTLVVFLGESVVDRTGLNSRYNFDIRWNEGPAQGGGGLSAEGIDLLVSNVEEQLGLRMSRANGDAKFWVVDHVERPAEN